MFDTIVTDRTRTIELWKEPKSEQRINDDIAHMALSGTIIAYT